MRPAEQTPQRLRGEQEEMGGIGRLIPSRTEEPGLWRAVVWNGEIERAAGPDESAQGGQQAHRVANVLENIQERNKIVASGCVLRGECGQILVDRHTSSRREVASHGVRFHGVHSSSPPRRCRREVADAAAEIKNNPVR